jgi:rubredoxin
MPLTLPTPKYKGIAFDNELEARWAVAFDELGIEWRYFHTELNYSQFLLPTLNMMARVFYAMPTELALAVANAYSNRTDPTQNQSYLLLVGAPKPCSYFAIENKEYGYEATAYNHTFNVCDYLIFDSTTTSEGRLFVNTGEDSSCFPMPIQSEQFEYDCENLAILKANAYSACKPFNPEPVNIIEAAIPAGATDFGTWFIEGDELVLKREDWRRIDFELCNSSAQILDWIFHYQGRITSEELGDMIEALQAILHPMANYCSNGVDKKANGLSLLRKWLALVKPKRQPIKPSLRFEILKRDNYRCQMCGVTAKDGAALEIDHITPVAKGGGNNANNLQVLCRDCNAGKSDSWQ